MIESRVCSLSCTTSKAGSFYLGGKVGGRSYRSEDAALDVSSRKAEHYLFNSTLNCDNLEKH